MQNRIKRTPEAAEYIGLAASTLEKMRLVGGGPRFIKLGDRAVGYLISDLDRWLNARKASSAAADVDAK